MKTIKKWCKLKLAYNKTWWMKTIFELSDYQQNNITSTMNLNDLEHLAVWVM